MICPLCKKPIVDDKKVKSDICIFCAIGIWKKVNYIIGVKGMIFVKEVEKFKRQIKKNETTKKK